MRIAVMIMSASVEPAVRNTDAIIRYVADDCADMARRGGLANEYVFYPYLTDGGVPGVYPVDGHDGCFRVVTSAPDDIYGTFEKTVEAYRMIPNDFDFIIRMNISCFLNIRMLDAMIGTADPDRVYCNAVNTVISSYKYSNLIYPRGDFWMMSAAVADKVFAAADRFAVDRANPADFMKMTADLDHVDDVLTGMCLAAAYGKEYTGMIKPVYYQYIPDKTDSSGQIPVRLCVHALTSRVKTTPAGMYSGYSWKDNEYRLHDVIKMRLLSDFYKKMSRADYDGVTFDDIVVPDDSYDSMILYSLVRASLSEAREIAGKKDYDNLFR